MSLRAVSSGAAAAAAAVNVTDGTTTIAAPGTIKFEGATVTNESGTAVVALGGIARTYKKRLNFDDAGLATGVAIYTPSAGEELLDAWCHVITQFNGTTPKADVGTFVNSQSGIMSYMNAASVFDLTNADSDANGAGNGLAFSDNGNISFATLVAKYCAISDELYQPNWRFVAENPLKVCISQTGATDGTPIDSTQGIVDVYFTVVTPSDLDA